MPLETGREFRFEPLASKHDRAAFSCEHERLDRYLKHQAGQDVRKRVAAVYVLTPDGKTVAGYYTLSQYTVDTGELPLELAQKLRVPKYDRLPATLLGRLARSKEFRGAGLGEIFGPGRKTGSKRAGKAGRKTEGRETSAEKIAD